MRHWILLDSTYLCHRAYHSRGNLQFEGNPTGVIYGFLQDIQTIRKRFATERLVFCWDHGQGLREQRFPFYKEKRRTDNSDEWATKQSILRPQIQKLKMEYISRLGYKNNFMQSGYEADDIIASIVHETLNWHDSDGIKNEKDEFTIVTGDQDMYQLIDSNRVRVYHPREDKIINQTTFVAEFGIMPVTWATVKTLAGCSSDEVPGMKGVGIKTACKYFAGKVKEPMRTKMKKFLQSKQALVNFQLVRLPFKGVKTFDLWDDERNEKEYRKLLSEAGINSLE